MNSNDVKNIFESLILFVDLGISRGNSGNRPNISDKIRQMTKKLRKYVLKNIF